VILLRTYSNQQIMRKRKKIKENTQKNTGMLTLVMVFVFKRGYEYISNKIIGNTPRCVGRPVVELSIASYCFKSSL